MLEKDKHKVPTDSFPVWSSIPKLATKFLKRKKLLGKEG